MGRQCLCHHKLGVVVQQYSEVLVALETPIERAVDTQLHLQERVHASANTTKTNINEHNLPLPTLK